MNLTLAEFIRLSKTQCFTYCEIFDISTVRMIAAFNRDEGVAEQEKDEKKGTRQKQNERLNSDITSFYDKHPGTWRITCKKSQSHHSEYEMTYEVSTSNLPATVSNPSINSFQGYSKESLMQEIRQEMKRETELEDLREKVENSKSMEDRLGNSIYTAIDLFLEDRGIPKLRKQRPALRGTAGNGSALDRVRDRQKEHDKDTSTENKNDTEIPPEEIAQFEEACDILADIMTGEELLDVAKILKKDPKKWTQLKTFING